MDEPFDEERDEFEGELSEEEIKIEGEGHRVVHLREEPVQSKRNSQERKRKSNVSQKEKMRRDFQEESEEEINEEENQVEDENQMREEEEEEGLEFESDSTFLLRETIRELETKVDFITGRYHQVSKEKKEAYNALQEMKGNIRVFCRVRPLFEDENDVSAVSFEQDGDDISAVQVDKKKFTFNQIFRPEDDQETIFSHVEPMINSLLDGYSVCIFAYGQTGSGKTYTMEGTEENPGINLNALTYLFSQIKEMETAKVASFEMKGSAFEIYNEQIRDLLSSDQSKQNKLDIRQGPDGIILEGATEVPLQSYGDTRVFLEEARERRSVGATDANEHSSRSHCV
eukprot:TRINITY_DN3516_c0_g1_i4.p2 TRINITY_DN3516_c0_g1~~TRINITY_DN3516_c0_g1_i4.p2  ORF type:complete len:342 (-),score=155.63 TRINITY_DN3516_c0_g1_i4:1027-2052(-)